MNIATALNKKYVRYTAVMLLSLCVNQKEKIRAFLLHSELEEEDFTLIRESLKGYQIEIVPLRVDGSKFTERFPRTVLWSIETYYRLCLLDLLPDDVERLLYLDVDIIVNQSLKELYETDFEEAEIIVAKDLLGGDKWAELQGKQSEMFASISKAGGFYFNAGVLLLNIEKMRRKYNFESYLRAIEEWNYEMVELDQDILNYVHWDKVKYMDHYKYNLFARTAHQQGMTYEKVKESAAIIHYTGEKPWESKNVHFDIEQLWWDYAQKTPFYIAFMEEFLHQSMFDTSVEKYMNELKAVKSDLEYNLNKSLELSKKLYSMLQSKND